MTIARRVFIVSFTLYAMGASLLASAQQAPKVYRIGVLGVASPTTYARQVDALRRGLRELGYIEGKNFALEFRWADGNAARLPELAAELVRMNPDVLVTANPGLIRAMEDAARSIKAELRAVETSGAADFERAFAALAKDRAEALIIADHTVFVAEAAHISRLANTNRIPVVGFVEIADTGGLMAYGVDFPVLWHRAATFIDRILKGAKPADLPVEQPMKFEFVLNLAAAKALGATIPNSVRMRANRVIE